jgi:hypothetical protein
MLRPEVESELIDRVRQTYPELEKLSAADIIGWALRKIIQEKIKLH